MALTTVVPECDQTDHHRCIHRRWTVLRFGQTLGRIVETGTLGDSTFEAFVLSGPTPRTSTGRYVGQFEARHLAVEQLREF